MLCLLLIFGLFPKVGEMKRAYQRVENGGPALLIDEKADKLVDVGSVDEEKVSSALNAIIPLVVLIAGVLLCDNDLRAACTVCPVCRSEDYDACRVF